MDEAIAVPCPACRAGSEAASPGRWLCRRCGHSGFLRQCAVCGLVSYVAEAQEWHQPWQCMWCRESNTGFTRYCDPAAATLTELAGCLRRYWPGGLPAAPPAGDPPAGDPPAAAAQPAPVPPAAGAEPAPRGLRPITAAKMQAIPNFAAAVAGAGEPAGTGTGSQPGQGAPDAQPGQGAPDLRPARGRRSHAGRQRRRRRQGRWGHAARGAASPRRGLRPAALALLAAAITAAAAFLAVHLARAGIPEQKPERPPSSFQASP